jgi:hypothetical protein
LSRPGQRRNVLFLFSKEAGSREGSPGTGCIAGDTCSRQGENGDNRTVAASGASVRPESWVRRTILVGPSAEVLQQCRPLFYPGAHRPQPRPLTSAPGALFRAPNLRYRNRQLDRRCLRCDKGVRARRSSAKYCSNACRQMAYLNRHAPPGGGGPLTWADIERLLWRPTPPDRD